MAPLSEVLYNILLQAGFWRW